MLHMTGDLCVLTYFYGRQYHRHREEKNFSRSINSILAYRYLIELRTHGIVYTLRYVLRNF